MTDDELMESLDVRSLWLVRAGGPVVATMDTLRGSLVKAREMSARGAPITSIVRIPDEKVMLHAEQIYRLWERLQLSEEALSRLLKNSAMGIF
jgi:hypothetical protein